MLRISPLEVRPQIKKVEASNQKPGCFEDEVSTLRRFLQRDFLFPPTFRRCECYRSHKKKYLTFMANFAK